MKALFFNKKISRVTDAFRCEHDRRECLIIMAGATADLVVLPSRYDRNRLGGIDPRDVAYLFVNETILASRMRFHPSMASNFYPSITFFRQKD